MTASNKDSSAPWQKHWPDHHTVFGQRVIVAKPQPRYQLPKYLLPEPYCIPWPAGFEEETNAWAEKVCGFQAPIITDNEVMQVNGTLYMNEGTWKRLKETAQLMEHLL